MSSRMQKKPWLTALGVLSLGLFAAAAETTDDVRLELVLKDNSLLRGRPAKQTMKVQMEILAAPVDVVLSKISHIEHIPGTTGFLLTFTNDDTISCSVLEESIELVTLLGKFAVPFNNIRAVRNVGAVKLKWRTVPNPRPRYGGYTEHMDIACDRDGVVWVMTRAGLSRFDGKAFSYRGFSTGFNLALIFGAPDRGLYVTQFDTSTNKGLLHHITDNGRKATPLTEYRLNSIYQVPCIHVAASRKIYNWGESFIRVFTPRPGPGQANGDWKEWEARLTREGTRVMEVDGRMYFFCNNQVWIAGADDSFATHSLKLTTRVMKAKKGKQPKDPPLVLARWDTGNIISFSPGDSAIQANAIDAWTPVDAEKPNEMLAGYKLHKAFALRDGSVLLAAADEKIDENLLLRLTRDGTVIPLRETSRLLGGDCSAISSIHEDAAGALWLAAGSRGVARYRKRNLTIFGPEDGLAGGRYFQVATSPEGNIWTLSRTSPYVLLTDG